MLTAVQSELVIQLQQEHFFDLLITIASQAEGSEWGPWNMVVLDILHLLFRGVNPVEVAGATSQGKASTSALNDLLANEKRLAKADKRKGASRHSRFGTTLTLTSVRCLLWSRGLLKRRTGQSAIPPASASCRLGFAFKGHRHGEEEQSQKGKGGGEFLSLPYFGQQ